MTHFIFKYFKNQPKTTNSLLKLSAICLLFLTLTAMSVKAQTDYCVPSTTNSTNYWTYNFSTTNAFKNVSSSASEFPAGGYENLSDTHIITHSAGFSFDFLHIISKIDTKNSLKIWIDWNNDFEFEDSEEVYFGYTSTYPYIQTGTITIPADKPIGNYRMRLRCIYSDKPLTACESQSYGAATDFTLSVIDPPTCLPITNLATANITFTSVDVSWDSQGTETSWNIEWGITGFSPGTGNEIGSQTVNLPNVSITGLTAETNYDVYIRADCGNSDFSFWQSISLFSGYCVANSINSNTSSFPNQGYKNASTTHTITHSAGSSFDFSHSYSNLTSSNAIRIWVDWNNDFEFEESEEVFFGYKTGFPTFQTGTITIPTNTSIGNYRMRLRSTNKNKPDLNACGLRQFGSTTDFTLSVIAPPSCLPVTNLATANITFTSVDVSWESQGTETSWIVEWGIQGFTPGTGAEIGAQTISSPNISINGLTAETNYDVYVRADCENSDFSIWRSISIFSGYCMPSTYNADSSYLLRFLIKDTKTPLLHIQLHIVLVRVLIFRIVIQV